MSLCGLSRRTSWAVIAAALIFVIVLILADPAPLSCVAECVKR